MKVSSIGIELITQFEGLELSAYRCSAGKWTIGHGHTGPDVTEGLVITQERADELLAADLARFEQGTNELVKVTLTQNQFDALVSFTFNCGLGAFKKSTLLKLINASKFGQAAEQFSRWTRAGNKSLPGLVRRREVERELFTRPEISITAQENTA